MAHSRIAARILGDVDGQDVFELPAAAYLEGEEARMMLDGAVGVDRPPVAVQIRRYRLDDAAAIAEAVRESIAELQPWMPWCHPDYSIDESRAWLAVQVPAFDERRAFEFAVVSADGRYLGGCGLNQIDEPGNRANLGYWIRSTATRRGVATAAVRDLRDWAFTHTTLIRLEIVVAIGNAASHRVAEKAGALREGTLRQRLVLHGTVWDATMFSFTRVSAKA